jgi:superfamily II DNA or RNA helicase
MFDNVNSPPSGKGGPGRLLSFQGSVDDTPGGRRPQLRPYQQDVIARTEALIDAGINRPLLVAPTGAGKTIIAAALVKAFDAPTLFLAHRRELIDQAAKKLWNSCGIDAGVILAGVTARPDQRVQVASIQTLWARAYRGSKMTPPPADVIFVDEAHHVPARTYTAILDNYPEAIVIGLTATPCRGDGRGLGDAFDQLVECPDVADLVRLGYLVPTKVYAPSTPDLRGVRVERGDYVERQLAERVDTPKLVGDVVTHWHRLGEGRKTVVFATGVKHSVHLRDEFRRSGVSAEHIDGATPIDEREQILRDLSDGKVKIVTNCAVLTEGWDQPDVGCIVLARPTKHAGLYRQMTGRVLRTAPGKSDAIVLDHAGSTLLHGFVEDPVRWTLDPNRRAESPRLGAALGASGPRSLTTCPECAAVRLEGDGCPCCGWRPRPKPRRVDVIDGDLVQLRRDGSRERPNIDQRRFYAELLGYAEERGYKPGFAYMKFREKFNAAPPWPRHSNPTPVPPTPEVRSWLRSRAIAYAKARAS